MAFTINTNVESLFDQYYLNNTESAQNQALTRLSSGLRINSSGDDAAGLAIANSDRSNVAVLTQGIRNANDGLSALQIADGGLNNISQLLDRARTLATQSASGTFTGDRGVLNSEFQSVLAEINREAQSMGLNTNGTFAKNLNVFVGGGQASGATTATANGSISFDLSKSTVDTQSLGLTSEQAIGGQVLTQDLGNSSATSVSNILANTANTGSEATAGYTQFLISGAGFSGANEIAVNVNLSGVVDTTTLVNAINAGITAAGNGASQYATAFKNANITASINTDSRGKQQLTFNSSAGAFQVEAGDRAANAFLGNYTAGSTGKDLTNTVTSGTATTAGSLTQAAVIRIQGAGLAAPVDIQIASGQTTAQALATISSTVANNTALQAAGVTVSGVTTVGSAGGITFTSKHGEQFSVQATGDNANLLGLGSFSNYSGGTSFDYTSVTGSGAAFTNSAAQTFDISINGGAVQTITATLSAAGSVGDAVNQLNTAFAQNAALTAAGLHASNSAGQVQISSTNGTAFRINANNAATNVFGFGNAGAVAGGGAATLTQADNTDNIHFNAIGEYATKAYNFAAPLNGQDAQTITFSANDAGGAAHTTQVVLQNNSTARNARSLDEAINTINNVLQATNDPNLTDIVAVKDFVSNGVEGIRFVSQGGFNVALSQDGTGGTVGVGLAADQGKSTAAAQLTTTDAQGNTISGGSADISNTSTAAAAVNALANSVTALGRAQAVVGRSENQLNYAVTLANSELTNTQAAESRIRDADLAAESANLTKANILLQAGVAALAQANSTPQQVLQLLKF